MINRDVLWVVGMLSLGIGAYLSGGLPACLMVVGACLVGCAVVGEILASVREWFRVR